MIAVTDKNLDLQKVVKRAMYLAWKASPVLGMGVFQDRPAATEDEVWACVGKPTRRDPLSYTSDYIFGRMMKCRLDAVGNKIGGMGGANIEYQGWLCQYKGYDDLIETAILSLMEESRS